MDLRRTNVRLLPNASSTIKLEGSGTAMVSNKCSSLPLLKKYGFPRSKLPKALFCTTSHTPRLRHDVSTSKLGTYPHFGSIY